MQSEELIPNRSWKKLKDTDLSLSHDRGQEPQALISFLGRNSQLVARNFYQSKHIRPDATNSCRYKSQFVPEKGP